MKNLSFIILLFLSNFIFAQIQIKDSSIDSGGNSATVGTTTIVQTIGETVVQEQTHGNIHISEGFIHPGMLSVSGIENYEQLTGISIYPNPATDYFNIGFQQTADYNIRLYDENGKEIMNFNNSDTQVQINVSHLKRAVYLLIIIDKKSKRVKTYKIEKS